MSIANDIRTKTYGKDVREAIAEGIELVERYNVDAKLIEIVGIGSMALGTSGVTKVGDCYFNTNNKTIYECTNFISTTNFTTITLNFKKGTIYTFNNELYVYNGTDLVSTTTELSIRTKELETKLIKLTGMGSASAGTSGVTKVGDCYFNTGVSKIYKCTAFTNSTTFEVNELNYINGAIYTFNNYLYVYNGTTLVSSTEKLNGDIKLLETKLIKITGIGSKGTGTSGVTKVGDCYFNSGDKLIHKCTIFRTLTDFDDVSIPLTDGAIYTLNNELYVYNGTTLISKASSLKLTGMGSKGLGTSGVTKVGDCYFNTNANVIYQCTVFRTTTDFDDVVVSFKEGAFYMFNNDLYVYDGTTLISKTKTLSDTVTSLDFKLIKLVGMGSASAGTSGVTKVGDRYFNIYDKNIVECTTFTSTTSFTGTVIAYKEGAIYTLNNYLYVYNGTTLVSQTKTLNDSVTLLQNKLIKLAGMGSMGLGTSGITKVGDRYFNINDKTIYECTTFISTTNFTTSSIPFVEGSIYTCNNELYVYDRTTLVNTMTEVRVDLAKKSLLKEVPDQTISALVNGIKFSDELQTHLTDFAKAGDLMVHTSSFVIYNGIVYTIFMVNYTNSDEAPSYLNIRLQSCPLSDPTNITYYNVCSIGDTYGGKVITKIYDSAIYIKDGIPHLVWNVILGTDTYYSLLHKTFNIASSTLSATEICSFTVGTTTNPMTGSGINSALDSNSITHPIFTEHIITMPKISTRVESGTTYYYTGLGTSSTFNCIVKTSDFINWIYVAQPTFKNKAMYEPCVYVINDIAYYFCRQDGSEKGGFLTSYDIVNKIWATPVYIDDTQSRPDFLYVNSALYLIKAPKDRNHISVMYIDTTRLERSYEIQVAKVPDYFYPISQEYNGILYMLFTQSRRHIYLSTFTIGSISTDTVLAKFKQLFLG